MADHDAHGSSHLSPGLYADWQNEPGDNEIGE
jgi:hypothetical protein